MSETPSNDGSSQIFTHHRLKTEFKTIAAMVKIYCRSHHTHFPETPCTSCQELITYARNRLLACPFQDKKPTCGRCTVHCYKKSMQNRVKEVMKFAGPKMVYRHPIMAFTHLVDARRKPPKFKKRF